MALVTLQTVLQDALPAYEQSHPLPAHVRRAARALMPCRTAALGGPIHACPDGHMARIWYHACRHRSCPPCADRQTERWLALQRARLVACDHDHGICTLPHALHALWLANVSVMSTLLVQAARDTLGAFLAAPKYLGAQPGRIAALHPWSQPLVWHPHVHGLVSGGGLTPTGPWVAVRHGVLWPVRVVMAVCRGTMLGALRQAVDRDALGLPEAMRPQQLLTLLKRVGHAQKTPWHVPRRERYRHGAGVVTSLARSLRGGPSKHARLVAWDGERVTLLSRGRQEEGDAGRASCQRLPLSVAALLQRWRQHGPVPQTRVVRCYGLYHHTHVEALALCRAPLGQPPMAVPALLVWQTACAQRGDAHPERCPACGPLLVCTEVIPRAGAPPPVLAEGRAA